MLELGNKLWAHFYNSLNSLVEATSGDFQISCLYSITYFAKKFGPGMHEESWEILIEQILFSWVTKSVDKFIDSKSWLTTTKA